MNQLLQGSNATRKSVRAYHNFGGDIGRSYLRNSAREIGDGHEDFCFVAVGTPFERPVLKTWNNWLQHIKDTSHTPVVRLCYYMVLSSTFYSVFSLRLHLSILISLSRALAFTAVVGLYEGAIGRFAVTRTFTHSRFSFESKGVCPSLAVQNIGQGGGLGVHVFICGVHRRFFLRLSGGFD